MKSFLEQTRALMEEAQTSAKASKYLAQSKHHAREAEAAKNWATLFKGEAGTIEKGIASKHAKLEKAHSAAAAALFDVHTIHKGKPD